MELAVFQFVSIVSCPGTGCHWKEPGSFLFALSLIFIGKIPLSLPFSRLNSPSWPFLLGEVLWSLQHLCGPSLSSLQDCHASLVLGWPEQDTVFQVWPHYCWGKWKDHFPWHAGNTSRNAAFAGRADSWLMFNLVSPRSFSAKMLSSWVICPRPVSSPSPCGFIPSGPMDLCTSSLHKYFTA